MLLVPIVQSGTPASAAEKVQVGPDLREWVARRIDTVDSRQRVENDLPPLGVLIIDHDMDLVFRFAERITVMVGGAVFANGTPKEIGANPQVRAVYLGQAGQEHGHG